MCFHVSVVIIYSNSPAVKPDNRLSVGFLLLLIMIIIVSEIAEKFDMTFATVSYHLKLLKKADLIDECREKGFARGFSPDDAIKEKASYVTTDAADDGIYNACSHFGWI